MEKMKNTFLIFPFCLPLLLSGCLSPSQPRPVAIPALSSVSVPLARAKDAIKVARDRIEAGDLPAAKAAISVADAKVEETSAALAFADAKVGELVGIIKDRDNTILSLRAENHQVAKERDIIPYVVALAMALWFLVLSDAIPLPGQYRLYLKGIAFVVGFGSGYASGRLLVRAIATFLP